MFYKLSFYFPAKAAGADMSFKDSFDRTKGYLVGLIFVPVLSTWRLMLASCVYLAVMWFALFLYLYPSIESEVDTLSADFEFELTPGQEIVVGVLFIPLACYFAPLFYAYGVAVLSNYYQHSLQIGPRKRRAVERA